MEKGNGDKIYYYSADISAEWQLNNPVMAVEPPSSMVDSLSSSIWIKQASYPHNFGFNDSNFHKTETKPPSINMPWNTLELQYNVLPRLPYFPTDTAFIERAARFSSFNSSNFCSSMNPIASRDVSRVQIQKCKEIAAFATTTNNRNDKNLASCGVSSSKESSKLELNGGQQEGDCSSKIHSSKKRKKTNQVRNIEQEHGAPWSPSEASKESVASKQKGEHGKPTSNNRNDAVEAQKEEYIHVRAPRGQATNSHSLAERLRREKISERMKLLQELVPGCSKVTGKAVMLDEIINYVQSLQKQVEFLSMKLAAVNPRLDFNMEPLHSKYLPQFYGGPSKIGFTPDHLRFHPTHQDFLRAGISRTTNMSSSIQRINAHSTSHYKESTPQIANMWDNQLHHATQMTYGADLPPASQDLNGKALDSFTL